MLRRLSVADASHRLHAKDAPVPVVGHPPWVHSATGAPSEAERVPAGGLRSVQGVIGGFENGQPAIAVRRVDGGAN